MKLHKYQALGNDYFICDPQENPIAPSTATIRHVCDRHFGFGSDGLLYGPLSGDTVDLNIFNPDGSEAEKSGNGLRIFTRYLVDTRRLEAHVWQKLRTKGGLVDVYYDARTQLIAVFMGQISFLHQSSAEAEPKTFLLHPVLIDQQVYPICISHIGNPHCTIFLDQPPRVDWIRSIGPILETHPLFPFKTNVQGAYVESPHHLKLEIWERGAGYTLASGSSASAAAAVAQHLGYCQSPITVHMPGGSLTVEIDASGGVTQIGPVKKIGVAYLSD